MVRMTTKPVQRRKKKHVDIENAPDSTNSSQSDVSKTVVETPSPVTSLASKLCRKVTQCPCKLLAAVFCVYLGIGCCLLPNEARRKAYWKPLISVLSTILSLLGFTVNVVKDVHQAVIDGRTQVWQQAMDTLVLFLQESGLEDEWTETLESNLFFADLVVLTDIQEQYPSRTALQLIVDNQVTTPLDTHTLLERGQKYMRYATAVYGREIIASAELQTYGHVHIYPTDTDAQVIARHTQLPPNGEVWFSDLTPGENPNHESLRTIVVCDHVSKAVIVSIRGTFSLSGVIVDLAGFCEEFCGGWAHAGFAKAARHTWETIWEAVLKDKMTDLPKDYDLILTGHSMGASVACLVTILLHHAPPLALQNRRIHCYAMAPAPVFSPLSAAPNAVDNITAFVHGWDCVPSLSVDAIRRFMHAVSRIDAVLQSHPVWQLAAERFELGQPDHDLIQAYQQEDEPRPLEQAPMLFVPAQSLIWLEHATDARGYTYRVHTLDPQLYANRVLDARIPDMMMDHMIPEYETAFELALSSAAGFVANTQHSLLRGG